MTIEENKGVVRRFISEVFEQGRLDAVDELSRSRPGSVSRTASASRTTSSPSNVLQPVVSAQAGLC
jgi:hypothetical protein